MKQDSRGERVERVERGDFNPMASKCVIISKP